MTLRICVLASGSSGNSTAIWNDREGVLIDCGCSCAYVERTLEAAGCDITHIRALLITHGHGDHIGAGAIYLAKKYGIPLFIHEKTFREVYRRADCGGIVKLKSEQIRHHARQPFSVGGWEVTPIPASHAGGSAGHTFGFAVDCGRGKSACRVGYLTDTGRTDDDMVAALAGCRAVVLEANHDPELVAESERPYFNKQWVLSDFGHLSNEASARLIVRIRNSSPCDDAPGHVFVAHISRQHNTVERALRQIQETLDGHNVRGITLIPTYHREKSLVLALEEEEA